MALTDVELNIGSGGARIGVDQIAGSDYEVVKQAFGVEGSITLVSSNNPLPVTSRNPSIATSTNVNDSASSVTLLAANSLRLGATFFNDSPEILYLKLGAVASLTSFTLRLVQNTYYELPFMYVGVVDGIWASDSSGACRITELTL